MPETNDALLAAIGNSRIRLGLWRDGQVVDAVSLAHDALDEAGGDIERLASAAGIRVLAGVHRDALDRFERTIRNRRPAAEVLRVGRDLPIDIRHSLDDPSTLGQDRLLNALAAFGRAKQACVVIDAGTAVTVDFIDGEGVFHGGVIAPGVRLMLASLHEHTDALPELPYETPDPARGPFGKDTAHAMRLGVRAAVVGLVRHATEQFAIHYEAYPQVIATGGDAGLFEGEGLVEHIVPDLQLLGIGLCLDRALADEE